jgi:hypothetical protein
MSIVATKSAEMRSDAVEQAESFVNELRLNVSEMKSLLRSCESLALNLIRLVTSRSSSESISLLVRLLVAFYEYQSYRFPRRFIRPNSEYS